ncbi:hypothetical protein VNI00_011362 [Paramarasmius palmivorus]|uniref:Hydrophobin n=1 Tax=Paramarasmius palmivorus TaxID=297713 RepID=A0AAW0CB63_9AGAR
MFKASAIALTAFSALVAAGECNTGPVQCCNDVKAASDPSLAEVFGVLGIVAQGVTGQVGVTCNPISVLGLGGNSCNAQTVCCENNNFNGVVALGCTPINVNL